MTGDECVACSPESRIAIRKVLLGEATHECVQPTAEHELAELAEWDEWSYKLTFPTDYFARVS